MRRIALSFVLALSAVSAFAQTDNSPKVFTNRFCVGTSATLNACTPTTFGVLDPTARVKVLQVRAALDSTNYPFIEMTHRTTVGGSDVRNFQFLISSAGAFSLYDKVGSHTAFSVDSSGNLTIPLPVFSGLTAGRVPFAGTGGALTDDADLTFATDTLTATKIIGSTTITPSNLTASQLVVSNASKALVSNGAITTNALAKSVSSGATLTASGVSDDGTNITFSEPVIQTKNVQGNEGTFALTSGAGAAAFATAAIPSNSAANIQVEYVLEASTATPHVQAFGGTVLFNAVNVAGSITCTTSTPTTAALATDGGTLTATFSCADATGGNLDLKVTDTSSISPTTNRIRYRLRALAATELVFTTH